MILKKLEIELQGYGAQKGQYTGTARFDGEHGSVALNLTPEHCEQIFKVCANGITEVAKEASRNLTCSVIEHTRAIGSKAGTQ